MQSRTGRAKRTPDGPVAQLDRASDYESEGRAFESLRVHHFPFHAQCLASPLGHCAGIAVGFGIFRKDYPFIQVSAPMPLDPFVLLVGASGRVGRMVLWHWPKQGALAVMPTCRSVTRTGTASVIWSPLDGPRGLLEALAARGQFPVAMVMLAGVTPGPGRDAAALGGNRALAEACLNAAKLAGIGRVMLASSSAVYGVDPQGRAFDETTAPQPVAPYGHAKLKMEQCAEPWRQAGLEVCALRIGNVAGADALLGRAAGLDGARLQVDTFDDGQGPLRSYIGAASLVRVLSGLATTPAPLPPVLNLAAPHPVRMTALCEAAGLPFDLVQAPPTAHQSITLDCTLLQSLVPMSAKDSDPADMVQQWKATLS